MGAGRVLRPMTSVLIRGGTLGHRKEPPKRKGRGGSDTVTEVGGGTSVLQRVAALPLPDRRRWASGVPDDTFWSFLSSPAYRASIGQP